MGKIQEVTAWEILDARGVPTVAGKLVTDTGAVVYSQVPSGMSIGKTEGKELRDNDPTRYDGKGVLTAVSYINNAISKKILGVDVNQYEDIDAWLLKADGTENYEKLGVNTILTISMLVFKAAAMEAGVPYYKFINDVYNKKNEGNLALTSIPTPIFTLMNGGMHGANNLDFQEFQIISPTSAEYSETLQLASKLHGALKDLFVKRNAHISMSDEGGYVPRLSTNLEAFDIYQELLISMSLKLGVDIFMGADCAANYYYKSKKYNIRDTEGPQSSSEYTQFIAETVKKYSMLIVEDPLSSDDHGAWTSLQKQIGEASYLVGDDLIGGSKKMLQKAIDKKMCNAITVKFNEFATITDMLSLIATAQKNDIKIIASHRMGETTDDFIADLAVGVQADFVKFGSPSRGERVQKYNRLLKINEELKSA